MTPAGWQGLAMRQVRRIRGELVVLLDGIPDADLDRRPRGVVNPVGWTAWHLSRGVDRNIAEIAGLPQAWVTDGWADRFGRAADPSDTKFGHTGDDVAAFRTPSASLLLAYHGAVTDLTEQYLRAAPDRDLQRATHSPTLGNTHTVEERLAALLFDSFAHLGQVSVVRALLADRSTP